jgi:hypothetical protein
VKRPSSQSRPTRRHRTAQEKAEILRQHRRSGFSLLAFARQQHLCYASLLRWRPRPGTSANAVVPPGPKADPGFVPVQLEAEGLSGEYVLRWPSGRTLQIPGQFATDSLRRLLSLLEGSR